MEIPNSATCSFKFCSLPLMRVFRTSDYIRDGNLFTITGRMNCGISLTSRKN